MIDNFKFHRVSRLLAVVCVALTISAPLATAYVTGGNSAAQTEQTCSQVDRSKKGDSLPISLRQKPVEGDGAKRIETQASRGAAHAGLTLGGARCAATSDATANGDQTT